MRRHLPLILTLAAVAVAVSILGWQLWLTFAPTPAGPSRVADRSQPSGEARGGGDGSVPPGQRVGRRKDDSHPEVVRSLDHPEPVRVPLAAALRFKAPLHANAPGRMPTKEGEREIGGDTLPPDPLAYARSLKNIDPALLAWVQRWHAAVAAGQPVADDAPPLDTTRLAPHELYELGRSVRFVQGDEQGGLSFYRAAIAHAAQTLVEADPEALAPSQVRDAHALRMMSRPLWQARDYRTAEALYTALVSIEPEGSFARFRALYLRGEAPYMRAIRGGEPELAPVAVQHFERMLLDGDTGGYTPTPREHSELVWAMGGSLFAAERYEDALPYLEQAAAVGDMPFTQSARLHQIGALAKLGRTDAARDALAFANLSPPFHRKAEDYIDPPPPPAWEIKINMNPAPDPDPRPPSHPIHHESQIPHPAPPGGAVHAGAHA